jgi:conjugal transfer pilus assembly protein TraE
MEIGFSQKQAQRVLKQRNMLAIVTLVLSILSIFALISASARDREVILQPIHSNPLSISSSAVTKDYLEMVTRDAAVMLFNRSPASLEYWMESVLKIVHPSAYGRMKGELLKLANDQRGSSVSYFLTIESMKIDEENLESEVTGVVHTMVGSAEVSAKQRTFRFVWTYTGLELRLVEFGVVMTKDSEGRDVIVGSPEASAPADTK